jgi:hypothetical protein
MTAAAEVSREQLEPDRFKWEQESSRFFEKSGAKNFCLAGPVAVSPARLRVKKYFCFFLFTKRSLPLRLDMTCPKAIRL